jgi:ureidoacrylate peracid hydrolase
VPCLRPCVKQSTLTYTLTVPWLRRLSWTSRITSWSTSRSGRVTSSASHHSDQRRIDSASLQRQQGAVAGPLRWGHKAAPLNSEVRSTPSPPTGRHPKSGSLAEKVRPSDTVLLVIDVQNDFCDKNGMMASEGFDVSATQSMADRLSHLLVAARAAGVRVVFVRSVHSTGGNWYLSEVWLEQARRRRRGSYTERGVCVPGTWGADFFGNISPLEGDPVITKHRYSAFWGTDLDVLLRSIGIRTLVATGVATNVCVETTVRDAFARDYFVVLVSDATAAYSAKEHAASLSTTDQYFGEVVPVAVLIEIWSRQLKVKGAASHAQSGGKQAVSSSAARRQPGRVLASRPVDAGKEARVVSRGRSGNRPRRRTES